METIQTSMIIDFLYLLKKSHVGLLTSCEVCKVIWSMYDWGTIPSSLFE